MSATAVPTFDVKFFVKQLKTCSDSVARKALLTSRREQLSLSIIIELANEARDLLRVNARESLSLAEIAIEIARQMEPSIAMAHAVRMKANALHHLGNYLPAIELHRQAIQLFEAAGQQEELGRTLSGSIAPLNLCGEYEEAFRFADRARTIFTELGDELRLARLEINVGNVY